MNRWPLVSIVTPSLNQGRYIRATIESVLSQDYPNLEYLVIDGGSKDETVEILQSYSERIHWISETDNGQSQAVNKGWKRSHGNILGWVNADDLLSPNAVRVAVEALLSDHSICAVYGDAIYINDVDRPIEAYPTQSFNYEILVKDTEDFIPQPSVFIRRNALEKAGFLDETLHYVMDYDLWLRIGLIAPMKYLPLEMAMIRLHSDTKTIKAMSKFANEFSMIFQSLFLNPLLPLSLQHSQNEIMHAVYIHSASFCFWSGATISSLRLLQRAWHVHPFSRKRTFWLLLIFSAFGKYGWKLAEFLHGNPMRLKKGIFTR